MGGTTQIDLEFAGEMRSFCLKIGQLRELQEKTGVGPLALFNRLISGDWEVDDIPQILRLGLIGGGMSSSEALKLIETHINVSPLTEYMAQACAVIGAALFCAQKSDDDSNKKKQTPDPNPKEC